MRLSAMEPIPTSVPLDGSQVSISSLIGTIRSETHKNLFFDSSQEVMQSEYQRSMLHKSCVLCQCLP